VKLKKKRKIITMKIKRIICILLSFALLFSFSIAGETLGDEVGIEYEEKILSVVTIDQDFCPRSVLVVMDKNVGNVNKRHDTSFFGDFPIENIQDLTEISFDSVNIEMSRQDGDMRKHDEIVADLIAVRGNEPSFRQILSINLPIDCKQNVLDVIAKLEKVDGIISAEVNGYRQLASPPNNPPNPGYNTSQWALGSNRINIPAAWNITKGSHAVRVGVIDTGIDNHTALNANLRRDLGRDFVINANGILVISASSTSRITDPHGTSVAGVIGAVWNGISGTGANAGVGGVCQNVTLIPLNVCFYVAKAALL